MALEQTWRWFGPKDPFSLKEIKQTGATGIVTALHDIPTGEVWSPEDIMRRKRMIEAEGLTWSVAESIPVHDDIKRMKGNHRRCLENYKTSIRNLGTCGVDTVCYHFMPILDWSRTDLRVVFSDGSITTRFEAKALAAFDLFTLKRPGAQRNYGESEVAAAKEYFESLSDDQKNQLVQTILLGFPGSGESYTLDGLRSALATYQDIGDNDLRENLHSFLREVIPVAEESGVLMAIHPDDPPWPLFGLPRVVSDKKDFEQLLKVDDSSSNGITLCTGSLGASSKNNLVKMAESLATRINFIHLRNVTRSEERNFVEDNHLNGDVDMYGVMKALVVEQKRRKDAGEKNSRMPFRPDHGHLMIPDQHRRDIYPGYSLFGRMRGLAELRGLELGITRSLGL